MFHLETIVDALTDDPNHILATAKHILTSFLANAFLLVSQEITHQFLAFHSKRNEPVAFLLLTYFQSFFQLIGIEADNILILGNNEMW